MKKIVILLCAAAFLTGCLKNEEEPSREITYRYVGTETLSVASEEGVNAGFGGGCFPCTMLRSGSSGGWFPAPVEGFDYEPGYEYVLSVDKYTVVLPDIPMCYQGAGYIYKLKTVVSKVQGDTEGISWYMPCYDASNLMPGQWAAPHAPLTVLRTAEEYSALVAPADERIEAFFTGYYSLLLLRGESLYGIGRIDKRLTYNGDGNYTLVIDVHTLLSAVVTPWSVAVVVPAIPPGARIDLQVNYL